LLLRSNLRLLHSQLSELAETPYFSSDLNDFIRTLREVLEKLLARLEASPPTINIDVAHRLANEVWELTQFLTGSTTKQIPYEVVFAIERAASEWTTKDLLITTAIVQEANFFFKGGSQDFVSLVKSELGVAIRAHPVQIALPFIYRHKPLFCLPLFHELGHYVDAANEIVNTSLLMSPEDVGPDLPDLMKSAEIAKRKGQERMMWSKMVEVHRKEYFADLFSAAYVGEAAKGFLQEFCPGQPASPTHPSTAARVALIDDFLNNRPNLIVTLLQNALTTRGHKPLSKRFAPTRIDVVFAAVRPDIPASDREVFGLFQDGWRFLNLVWNSPPSSYATLSEEERERVVNDLAQKSIRNRMIVEGWNAALNTP
jgi:hypothetical protein